MVTLLMSVYSYKDHGGIENPVQSDNFSLNDYESVKEMGHAVAQSWILSKSELKEVGYLRID